MDFLSWVDSSRLRDLPTRNRLRSLSDLARVASLALLQLLFSADARALTTLDALIALKHSDELKRFETSFLLVVAKSPTLDNVLDQAIERGFFSDSPHGLVAAEFVRRFRSGDRSWVNELTPSRPNVVLISIDTLRADHLGCYGYDRPTSPAIDALAKSGALFERALSPSSWTLPAHMSLFTSLYPSFHKLEKGGKVGSTRLDPSERTLAEIFQ